MKIAHVTPSYHPAYVYGGPTVSSYELTRHLGLLGHDVRVLTTDANGPDEVLDVDTSREVDLGPGLRVRYCHRIAMTSASPTLLAHLSSLLRWADVVHVHAVYSFPTIPTLFGARAADRPLVWTPRGALQRWEHTKKRPFKTAWELLSRAVLPRRSVLHVTSDQEAKQSAARIPGVRVVVIPNGVLIPDEPSPRPPRSPALRLLFVGRLDPIKALDSLIDALALLHRRGDDRVSLVIAGGGNPDYARSLAQRSAEAGLSDRIQLTGDVRGEQKERLYQEADVFVLPSHSENFGIAIAEALARGLPAIASRGTPWRGLEDEGAGIWAHNSPEGLASAIVAMRDRDRDAMGSRARAWVKRAFAWEAVAASMTDLYKGLL